MTNIVFKKSDGFIVSGEISGHSGYAEEGSDIVCAAVSSVTWCILNGLESFLGEKINISQEDAFIFFEIKDISEEEKVKADVLLQSMDMFFDSLMEQYPLFISKSEV